MISMGFDYDTSTGWVVDVTHECVIRADSYIDSDNVLHIRAYKDFVNVLVGSFVDLEGHLFFFEDVFDLSPTSTPTFAPTTNAPTSAPTIACDYVRSQCVAACDDAGLCNEPYEDPSNYVAASKYEACENYQSATIQACRTTSPTVAPTDIPTSHPTGSPFTTSPTNVPTTHPTSIPPTSASPTVSPTPPPVSSACNDAIDECTHYSETCTWQDCYDLTDACYENEVFIACEKTAQPTSASPTDSPTAAPTLPPVSAHCDEALSNCVRADDDCTRERCYRLESECYSSEVNSFCRSG
ncbi:hypothetical protein CYMTET_37068 [Cymbomonas tetramitiformis]|uniref:Uncharacterized protein n=1 Tax=Cymbomonas tetramitiformis TaxID=36881 RepID=A0AAE0F6N2_9CHLO|nr:hypothetical protein CYMTET_37068 [Cymbomonas tetramitiformis]